MWKKVEAQVGMMEGWRIQEFCLLPQHQLDGSLPQVLMVLKVRPLLLKYLTDYLMVCYCGRGFHLVMIKETQEWSFLGNLIVSLQRNYCAGIVEEMIFGYKEPPVLMCFLLQIYPAFYKG